MKYLITGGAGFIGSYLVEKLVDRGEKVTVLDNFSSGDLANLKKVRSKIELIDGDILNSHTIKEQVLKTDFVIHLAAAVGVLKIVNSPLLSMLTNLKGTQEILENCSNYKKPLLLFSTSEVYGKNNKIPLNENDDRVIGHPLLARWTYSESKAMDESLAYFYHKERGLSLRIVRLFNTVGPRQIGDYGMVLPRFVDAAISGKPILVHGNGNQIRCFCHVDDVVRALLLIMDDPKAIGQVFNVGNDTQTSIIALAQLVKKITKSDSIISNVPYQDIYPNGFEDMLCRVPDISKIRNFFGWSPEITLEQIVKDIVDFQANKF